jgi:outer membrane protein OmpA-like peptidoglycan-associated protein
MRFMVPIVALLALALLAGCATKGYVNKTVGDEQTRAQTAESQVAEETATNKVELEKLKALAAEIDKKADLAINEAKGFESYQVIWEGEIYFDFNATKVTVEAAQTLDEAGDKMLAAKSSIMELAGYCDPVGSDSYNMELGTKRADAAKYYLVDNFGITLFRFFTVSFGDRKAAPMGDTSASNAKERKVKMRIWDKP